MRANRREPVSVPFLVPEHKGIARMAASYKKKMLKAI